MTALPDNVAVSQLFKLKQMIYFVALALRDLIVHRWYSCADACPVLRHRSGSRAFKVIAILLSRADLPAERVDAAEAQLVRMQPVPWLCLLLKPKMR